ncbi:MAG TPA: CehA/McbA family metallohydrolase, partial [Verrucomicrobiae bacterium]
HPSRGVDLRAGESASWSRFLAVGTSPADALGKVAAYVGNYGTISGTLKDKQGKAVTSATIKIHTDEAFPRECIAYPDAKGEFNFAFPAGKYEIEIADLGRKSLTNRIDLKYKGSSELDSVMSVASGIVFDIRDESGRGLPCTAQLYGINGTPTPDLGPISRAHGCKDQYFSENGQFEINLPAGTYKIIVTRGIEYSHLENLVTVTPEKTVKVEGVLKRLVDTTGWVSADYHNHAIPSGDSSTSPEDRIINLAAEHIEFAPTTEHNRLFDWRPYIERLGLKDFIQTVAGVELTGSGPHLNSFPFKPHPFTQDNGAPEWNIDPRLDALTLRDWQGLEPDRWVQLNHPDMVESFIDRNDDGKQDGGYVGLAQMLDGLETQNSNESGILLGAPFRVGKDDIGWEKLFQSWEFIWMQMLNRGHHYTAMAVCDAHTCWGNGAGTWRTYMPSKTDKPSEIDWKENSRHAKAGHTILTCGPYLQVQTESGALPGDTVVVKSEVKLKVKVQCTDWIDIDRVQVLVNGRPNPNLNFTRSNQPSMFGNGVVKFDQTIAVPLERDAHLIVVAWGENFDLSTGYGTSTQAKMHPCAYNNPIFVDVDGGGFQPNGDVLDWPLVTKKMTVEEFRKRVSTPQDENFKKPRAGK